MLEFWSLLAILCVSAAIGLLYYGWRGRLVGDHPICRGCGFDLLGLDADSAGNIRCPECGGSKAPRIGFRQRKPLFIRVGLVLLLIGLMGGGNIAFQTYSPVWVAGYKPTWLLRLEARTGDSSVAVIAMNELTLRVISGGLNDSQKNKLMGDCVAYGPAGKTALASVAFAGRWDRLAAELMRAGYGTPAQREAIGRSWFHFRVETRPTLAF